MTTKTDIIAAVQAAADAAAANPAYSDDARSAIAIGLGTPGRTVAIAGQRMHTGSAWAPEPCAFATLVEGIANWLDAQGSVGTIRSTLNTLITQHNQLLADYNNGVHPSTATTVTPLP